MNYEDLPEPLKGKMFSKHIHGEMANPEEIVYREADVLEIIQFIFDNKT